MAFWMTDTADYDTAYGMRYTSRWDETTQPDPEIQADEEDEYREEER